MRSSASALIHISVKTAPVISVKKLRHSCWQHFSSFIWHPECQYNWWKETTIM